MPTQIKPLAGPLAGAIRNLATEATQRALASPHVQEVWRQANRAADPSLVRIVIGGKGAIVITKGEDSLDLAAILANITSNLGLPSVSSKLPPSVAKLKILKSSELSSSKTAAKLSKASLCCSQFSCRCCMRWRSCSPAGSAAAR